MLTKDANDRAETFHLTYKNEFTSTPPNSAMADGTSVALIPKLLSSEIKFSILKVLATNAIVSRRGNVLGGLTVLRARYRDNESLDIS
jgi:hypothetical protein